VRYDVRQIMSCVLIFLEPKKERLYLIRQSNYVHPDGFKIGFVASGNPEEYSFETFRASGMDRIRELLEHARTTSASDDDLEGTPYEDSRRKLARRIGARYSDWLLSEQEDGDAYWISKDDRNIVFPSSISGTEFLDKLYEELAPFYEKQKGEQDVGGKRGGG